MGNLQPLALARKNDGVVTDDVTCADRAKSNGIAIPRTGPTFSAINCRLGKIPPQCFGHDRAQTERRARRRINLVGMMGIDNLYIVAVA